MKLFSLHGELGYFNLFDGQKVLSELLGLLMNLNHIDRQSNPKTYQLYLKKVVSTSKKERAKLVQEHFLPIDEILEVKGKQYLRLK